MTGMTSFLAFSVYQPGCREAMPMVGNMWRILSETMTVDRKTVTLKPTSCTQTNNVGYVKPLEHTQNKANCRPFVRKFFQIVKCNIVKIVEHLT